MTVLATQIRGSLTKRDFKNLLWRRAGQVPALDLWFGGGELRDLVSGRTDLCTFTRASSGWELQADGATWTERAINVPRFSWNPVTGRRGVLVEESRQNLLLNTNTLSTQSVTVTAAAHTLSFTGTGTVTLSDASTAGPLVGAGAGEANRVSLSFTPSAGTLTLTVTGTVTNAQLGLSPSVSTTSYIPNGGISQTRSADILDVSMPSVPSLDECMIYAEWSMRANDILNATIVEGFISPGITVRGVTIEVPNPNTRRPRLRVWHGAARYDSISNGPPLPFNALARAAVRVSAAGSSGHVDGASVTVAGTPVQADFGTFLGIGRRGNTHFANTLIHRIAVFPSPGTAAQANAATAP